MTIYLCLIAAALLAGLSWPEPEPRRCEVGEEDVLDWRENQRRRR